jgi:Domain of unknown function (DUF4262)
MHLEFEWPEPKNEGDVATLRHIREHGCSILNIPWGGSEKEPPFSFSIGLFANYGHPELILFGISGKTAGAILNEIRFHVANGRKFVDGDIADDILGDGSKVCFWDVPLMAYPQYMGTALWFYDKCPIVFPCLQVIWQDDNYRFPWDTGCDPEVIVDQPLLKKMVS